MLVSRRFLDLSATQRYFAGLLFWGLKRPSNERHLELRSKLDKGEGKALPRQEGSSPVRKPLGPLLPGLPLTAVSAQPLGVLVASASSTRLTSRSSWKKSSPSLMARKGRGSAEPWPHTTCNSNSHTLSPAPPRGGGCLRLGPLYNLWTSTPRIPRP